jgi:DNA-directed RNA polymerase subunit RPC12/RpoP
MSYIRDEFSGISLTLKSSQSSSQGEGIFNCVLCGQSIAIDVRAVGTEVDCPHCEGEIVVPSFSKGNTAASGSGDSPIKRDAPQDTGHSALLGSSLPAPRKEGELPRVSVPQEGSGEHPVYRFTSAAPSPIDSAALISAISRGEVGILKARKVGRRRVAFGCPFCAKPIEIKLKQQGKELQCPECSGTMIAPDHDTGLEAQPVSGQGGTAGGHRVELPGVKTRSLQESDSRKYQDAEKPSKVEAGSSGGISAFQKTSSEQSFRHRLNNEREVRLVPRDAGGTDRVAGDKSGIIEGSGQGSSTFGRKLRFLAIVIMCLSMLGIVIMSLNRGEMLKGQALFQGQSGQEQIAQERSPAKDAISLCGEFSLQSTVSQRLKYIRHPDESIGRMQRYYAGALNSLVFPPLNVKSYQETVINGIRFARMTSIVEPGERQREFFFEVTDTGLLLDWESAVGYCEVDAVEYSADPFTGPVQMRVLVKPAAYYAFDFKDANMFDCYEITDLTSRIRIHGYVEKGSENAMDLRGLHPGGEEVSKGFIYCTLMLRASESTANRNARQVKIEQVVKDSWLVP